MPWVFQGYHLLKLPLATDPLVGDFIEPQRSLEDELPGDRQELRPVSGSGYGTSSPF